MRHQHWLAALLIPALAASALAQGQFIELGAPQPAHPPAPIVFGTSDWTSSPLNSAAAKAAHEALDKPLAKFSVSQMPLGEALASLAKDGGITLDINWTALSSFNINRTQRVSLAVEQTPPAKILMALLHQANPDSRPHFLVDGGTVVVSTADDLHTPQYQTTVAYDVGFLFADVEIQSPQAEDIRTMVKDTLQNAFAPETWRDSGGTVGMVRFLAGQMIVVQTIDVQEQVAQFVAGLQGSALKSLRVYDVHDIIGDTDKDRLGQLVEVIETSCGRDTWRDRGGSSGSIAAFDGRLYINASPVVHQQIEIMLGLMRKK